MKELFSCKVEVERVERPEFWVKADTVADAIDVVLEVLDLPMRTRTNGAKRFTINILGTGSGKSITRYF